MADPFKSYRTASGRSITQMLTEHGEAAAKSLGTQLYREGQGILASSMGLVPVDTGALRSSGYVTEPEREGDHIVVEIGYGGPAAKINPKSGDSTDGYAIFVHENLEAHHPVGCAKFLELPFNQATRGMSGRIAQGMRDDAKAGFPSDIQAMGDSEG